MAWIVTHANYYVNEELLRQEQRLHLDNDD